MSDINAFLLKHEIFIAKNPCVSPDFCLDWQALALRLARGDRMTTHERSTFEAAVGAFTLVEDERGEHAWLLKAKTPGSEALGALAEGVALPDGRSAFPASWQNLLRLKNLVLEHDAGSTIFRRLRARSPTRASVSARVSRRFTGPRSNGQWPSSV